MKESTRLKEALSLNRIDTELRRVYADALYDEGKESEAARQRRIADAIDKPSSLILTKGQEGSLRKIAGTSRCPVKVVAGDSPPTVFGEPGHSKFKKGGRCNFPGGAMQAGFKVHYVRSTLRVEVGVLWLVKEGWVK